MIPRDAEVATSFATLPWRSAAAQHGVAPADQPQQPGGEATKMKARTLFTALAIAQARTPDAAPVPARLKPSPTDDTTLLNALRNSATDRDQIIQRRIGLFTDTTDQT
jgi:hypothetical protein